MNQILPVKGGVLVAIEQAIPREVSEHFMEAWRERLPDVPMFIIGEAQIVQLEGDLLFQFTGDVTDTFVAEFQRWWEAVNDRAEA